MKNENQDSFDATLKNLYQQHKEDQEPPENLMKSTLNSAQEELDKQATQTTKKNKIRFSTANKFSSAIAFCFIALVTVQFKPWQQSASTDYLAMDTAVNETTLIPSESNIEPPTLASADTEFLEAIVENKEQLIKKVKKDLASKITERTSQPSIFKGEPSTLKDEPKSITQNDADNATEQNPPTSARVQLDEASTGFSAAEKISSIQQSKNGSEMTPDDAMDVIVVEEELEEIVATETPIFSPAALRTIKINLNLLDKDKAISQKFSIEDKIWLELVIYNTTEKEISLEFFSGQHFDFTVSKAGSSQVVWQWSNQMMFTQALSSLSLAPGETSLYKTPLQLKSGELKPGTYTIAAWLVNQTFERAEKTLTITGH